MKLINQISSIILLLVLTYSMKAQQITLAFSQPTVDCNAFTVCYDAIITSNDVDFGLSNYNLRLFYDASRLSFVANSPNTNSLPASYVIGNVIDQNGNLTGLGSLPFEATLGLLELGVVFTGGNAAQVTAAPINAMQNICFTLTDQTILSDDASCFDLIWVTDVTNELYLTGVTTVNNFDNNSQTVDLANSTYVDLTSASNCLAGACNGDPCDPIVDADGDGICDVGTDPDPDPQNPCIPNTSNAACAATLTYELDFTDAMVDCDTETVCYNVTIAAPVSFDLGAYNLRLFYDGDILDLIDSSPNLAGDALLNGSYTITSINDMPGGNQSGNGSLPFDDNLDIADVAVEYLGSNPIVTAGAPRVILYDLCFNVVDANLLADPAVCINAVWVTNATEENYTVGETTVNVAIGNGVTTNLDGSVYNDLNPNGAQCLTNACNPTIPTMGEWGLMSLSLLILIFGVVAIKEKQTELLKG